VLPHFPRNLQHPSGNRSYLPKVKGKGGLTFSAFIYVFEIVDNHQDHITPQSELKRSTFWVECASIFFCWCAMALTVLNLGYRKKFDWFLSVSCNNSVWINVRVYHDLCKCLLFLRLHCVGNLLVPIGVLKWLLIKFTSAESENKQSFTSY
jgi:hypothetical protein